ncbi:MAG: thermonuclease family protein [Desulfobulbaceae bacterium]|nr:thermonuclease family protein [Desulfobulbaceae bacterium]
MLKWLIIMFFLVCLELLVINFSMASRGCCSYHGGVCGARCCDGTALSEKCREGLLPKDLGVKGVLMSLKKKVYNIDWFGGCPEVLSNLIDDRTKKRGQSSNPPLPVASYSGCDSIYVLDGDTIQAMCDGQKFRIRLWGIDTPEKKQSFGPEATSNTALLVLGKKLEVEIKATDRYGRQVAMIKVDGISVNEAIIAQGYGWVYRQYCTEQEICERWVELERQARVGAKGLWSEPYPVMPWQWRRYQGLMAEFKNILQIQP